MIILSHIAYPSLIFMIIASLFGIDYSLSHLMILITFSLLPDIDLLFHLFIKKENYDSRFQHHKWFTHWPISYLPLFALLYFSPSMGILMACLGIFSHLLLDTFFSGDGIMWFYPFSRRFYNFFGHELKNSHGAEWLRNYMKKRIYKVDIVSFMALLIILIKRV